MVNKALNIVQISVRDIGGGAERVAWGLYDAYRQLGLKSRFVVGYKFSNDPQLVRLPNQEYYSKWVRFWRDQGDNLSPYLTVRGAWQLQALLYGLGQPQRWINTQRGCEDFDFPGVWHLFESLTDLPDIVQCHTLHGGYFDLRALPWLSHRTHVILTLHDAWLMTGHCAYSFDCERWQSGCGQCPYLGTYPSLTRDNTAYNWQRKQAILTRSKIYISTPSDWLMQKAVKSLLVPAIQEARVIPNGIDLSIFQPADQQSAREALGLPQNAAILLFVANGIRHNSWKDYQTLRNCLALIAERASHQNLYLIALGEAGPSERIGAAEIHFVPYQKNPRTIARYYQAADLYLHAARADTFPTTVLEALGCGTPVIATAVGGIPEQIKSLEIGYSRLKGYSPQEATGILVAPGDAKQMAQSVLFLLNSPKLRRQLSDNAARDAQARFNLEQQVNAYLEWYQQIVNEPNQDKNALSHS